MKKTAFLILLLSLSGCANFLTVTGTGGTSFGMSREAVMKVIEKKRYTIISQNENIVVVNGMQEQLKVPAIKTFYFQDNKLVRVEDQT